MAWWGWLFIGGASLACGSIVVVWWRVGRRLDWIMANSRRRRYRELMARLNCRKR